MHENYEICGEFVSVHKCKEIHYIHCHESILNTKDRTHSLISHLERN